MHVYFISIIIEVRSSNLFVNQFERDFLLRVQRDQSFLALLIAKKVSNNYCQHGNSDRRKQRFLFKIQIVEKV